MGWRRWDFSAWVVAAQYGPGTGLHRQQIFNTIRLYTKVDTTGFNRTMYVIGRLLKSEFYSFSRILFIHAIMPLMPTSSRQH